MIGDWVFSFHAGRNVQIRELLEDSVVCSKNLRISADENIVIESYDNISPIPLTSEILEKNGFMRIDFLDYSGNRIGISLLYKDRSNCEEGFRVLIEKRSVKVETRTTIKPVKYVHEIQHTMKDLEIEKEIIL